MKYIINYYHKIDGTWRLKVKTTEDVETLAGILYTLDAIGQYKLYSVTTDWTSK